MSNVKKWIIKVSVFVVVFLISLFVGSQIMNRGHNNMTMDMAAPSLPELHIVSELSNYNSLSGHKIEKETAFERDTITVLGEKRELDIEVTPYGRNVTDMMIELRSMDGERLIEKTALEWDVSENSTLRAEVVLKDLIEKKTEYSLTFLLCLDGLEEVRYYTRVIWDDDLHLAEKMAFVQNFHESLYDKENAQEITRYLEPNSNLDENVSLHKVSIHSSFQQVTWGDLPVTEVMEPTIQLSEIDSQTASFLMEYVVKSSEGKSPIYYMVQEYYRVRYTADRMYLLDYERTMDQIPDINHLYANDKLLLGIATEDVPMIENEDGGIVVFTQAGSLISYNSVSNKIAKIFSFYDKDNKDRRTINNQHDIKILDVDEAGNVAFAVYGYMNRGRHEGEVGLQLNAYDSVHNTVEELLYLPYSRSYSVLKKEVEELLYINRGSHLYVFLNRKVYSINLMERNYQELFVSQQDDMWKASDSHKIICWQEGEDVYSSNVIQMKNLNTGTQKTISVEQDELIRPLGFMEEDMIYGVAKRKDIVRDHTGSVFFPMYKLCICDSDGKLLKEYSQADIYIMDCVMEDNQITLERMMRTEDGTFTKTTDDHITDNTEPIPMKNQVVSADIEKYQHYVQIQTKKEIEERTLKVLTPKEVVFEGGRDLPILTENEIECYYVFGAYGIEEIYSSPANAIMQAERTSAIVMSQEGNVVWRKEPRKNRNQIMAIQEMEVSEGKTSLGVCLDTMLNLEGVVRYSDQLMNQGATAMSILSQHLESVQVLDLMGCSLDSVLYYVNQDIPVMVILENGEAVLITGFNQRQIVVMDPASGTLEKKNSKDYSEYLEENGNRFISYARLEK